MKSGATPAQMWSQVPTANKVASVIKSIQRGTLTITSSATGTATITAVVTAKTEIRLLGCTSDNATWDGARDLARIALTDSTTITGTRKGTSADTLTASWEATEYY